MMDLVKAAARSDVTSVDSDLAKLAANLRVLRGHCAAQATILEQIDHLLDQRLRLGPSWVDHENSCSATTERLDSDSYATVAVVSLRP